MKKSSVKNKIPTTLQFRKKIILKENSFHHYTLQMAELIP